MSVVDRTYMFYQIIRGQQSYKSYNQSKHFYEACSRQIVLLRVDFFLNHKEFTLKATWSSMGFYTNKLKWAGTCLPTTKPTKIHLWWRNRRLLKNTYIFNATWSSLVFYTTKLKCVGPACPQRNQLAHMDSRAKLNQLINHRFNFI